MNHIRSMGLAALPLLAACGAAPVPGDVLDTVRMTEQAQIEALQAKDVAGVVRVYANDAALVAPGAAPVSGVAAIRSAVTQLLADPNFKAEYKQGRGWAAASGDLAVTTGTGAITATDSATGKPATTGFKYQTVWHKGDTLADSGWKIVSDYDVAQAPASEEK